MHRLDYAIYTRFRCCPHTPLHRYTALVRPEDRDTRFAGNAANRARDAKKSSALMRDGDSNTVDGGDVAGGDSVAAAVGTGARDGVGVDVDVDAAADVTTLPAVPDLPLRRLTPLRQQQHPPGHTR